MSRTAWSVAALAAEALLLAGCGTTDSIPYKASADTVISIQQALQSPNDTVALGVIRVAPGVDEAPLCRLVKPVEVAAGKSLSQYIKDAFKEELLAAQVYRTNAPTVIDVQIEALNFSSLTQASWQITLRVKSNRATGYEVSTTFPFESSYFGDVACRRVTDAFKPAVQALLKQVVSDPRFGSLVVPPVAATAAAATTPASAELRSSDNAQSSASPPAVRHIDPATGMSDEAKLAYANWRGKPIPRAFVVCAEGHWESAWGAPRDHSEPKDPMPRALLHAHQHGRTDCRPYAVDDRLAEQN